MQLARVADGHVAHGQASAAARVVRGVRVGRAIELNSQGARHGLGERDRVLPARGDCGLALGRRQPLAGQHGRDERRLLRQRGIDRRQFVVGRALLDRRHRRDAHGAAEDRAHLVQRKIGLAAGQVPGDGSEQPGQHRRTQIRRRLRERVRDAYDLATLVLGCDAELVEVALSEERELDDLDETGSRERRAQRATGLLPRREATPTLGARQYRHDRVEPDLVADLFDVVVRVDEVRAPRRRCARQRVPVDGHVDARPAQDLDDPLRVDGRAEHLGGQ